MKISTHTLTWSVTSVNTTLPVTNNQISTHTLTWSVTLELAKSAYERANFNSHAHVERDDFGYGNGYVYENFNSHAHVERDLQTTKHMQ